jgi:hypothetical protein
MARRGSNHSFNKRQKERKRKEKAEKKEQRRLLRKQQASGEAEPATDEGSHESPVELAAAEAGSQPEHTPSSIRNE